MKICHGFILVSQKFNKKSLAFIDKQMENIINHSKDPRNVMFIVNNKEEVSACENTENEFLRELDFLKTKYSQNVIANFNNLKCYMPKLLDWCSSDKDTFVKIDLIEDKSVDNTLDDSQDDSLDGSVDDSMDVSKE